MTPFEAILFISIWSTVSIVGALIIDLKKNPGCSRGSKK